MLRYFRVLVVIKFRFFSVLVVLENLYKPVHKFFLQTYFAILVYSTNYANGSFRLMPIIEDLIVLDYVCLRTLRICIDYDY